jgi:DNA-directed RNA polymerase subunit RPC12/RpoP
MNQQTKLKATIIVSSIIQKIQMFFGVLFILFAILGVSASKKQSSDFVMGIIFLGLGAWLVYASKKRKSLINNFKTYVSILSNIPTGSIDNLAANIGTSQDVVRKNLQLMIDKKYFTNAYINTDINCIVLPSNSQQTTFANTYEINIDSSSPTEYVTITCKSCGGVNKIKKDSVYECEYCGTQIS